MKYDIHRHSAAEGKAVRKKAGAYIQRLRLKAGLTQAQLGQQIGESQSYVSQTETGCQALPSEAVTAWASALAVSPSEFGWRLLRHYDPAMYDLLKNSRHVRRRATAHPRGSGEQTGREHRDSL